MRAIPAILLILAFSIAAEESKPTLAETLDRERKGVFDDSTKDAADQIDDARDRFYRYYEDSDDVDERKAIREAFKAVAERIIERARQRVREAEERLEQLEQRQLKRRAGRSEKA